MPTNDNEVVAHLAPSPIREPHGQAALLLVESLIHGLCEKQVINASEAAEIAERAANVQRDRVDSAEVPSAEMWQAHTLLSSIELSLRIDMKTGQAPPTPS